jgi:gliding motility-associated-like protein
MRATKATLLVLLTSIVAVFSSAQRGKDGTFTVANPNSIVNSYTSLFQNALIGNTSITVTNSALNTGTVGFTYAAPLAQGDLIMIIQTQGAELDINTYTVTGFGGNYTWADTFFIPSNPWVNPWVWGRVKNYNSSGKYEVVEVLSVQNSTINLTCGLQNNYSATGKTQIVRIPRFQDLTLANSATIIPTNWLGQTGGVVALEVNGNLTLNSGSKITATGRGFRGATTHFGSSVVSCSTHGNGPGKGNSQLGSSSAGEGAKKGEGIGGYEAEYFAVFSTYGRGAAGNGGGGGGYQNSGGGGGSNVSVGTYTGKGVPSTTFANSVWNLESPNLGGSASSGGGRGGYSLSTTDQNEWTVGPNNLLWCNSGAGDARKENGGFGGHNLAYDSTRVFMGGGGGAGDGNNLNQPGAGGNGGGIVFVTCYGTIGGSGSIESDGNVGQNSNPSNQSPNNFPISANNKKGNDGAGGAGGGGSIIIKNANPIVGNVALFARGGNGGDQVLTYGSGGTPEASGPGGGGAGGFVAVANGSPTISVAGGNAGTTNSTQVSNFNVNGATGGAPGVVQSTSFFNLIPTNATICTGATANLSVTVVGPPPVTITWYTQPFGGTAVGTGTSFTTPALSTTTTYYVGTCPSTFRVPVTVTVTSGTVATFAQLGPFCSGQSYTLPNTSSNGLTGTWSPAINTSTTTNYTFTPTAGQCGLPATMTVVINSAVTPAFTQVAPVCIGTAFTLPTTSTNGITGTWSPAINISATTTYSFTPTAGQCANAATMTVTVNPNVTPNFVQVASICSGGSFTLSATSTNGITGTWSPAINNNATTTYSFTPAAGQCANITTMTVTVNPNVLPAFTQVAPICAGGTFTLPVSSSNGISGSWSPAINNNATTTYTFTPAPSQCANNTTMTVSVGPPITPTFTQVAPVCAGTVFTLPISSNEGITGIWSPAINTSATTTYSFTPAVGQCANTTAMTVTVNQQITPTFPTYGPFCLNDVLTQVMLPETSNNGITGTWNPGMLSTDNSGVITYTFTPNAGQCASIYTSNVTVNELPIINLSTAVITNENCGQSDGSINGILLSGGGGNYQIEWNNSPQLNTLDLVNLSSGAYTLEVEDANGCMSQVTVNIQDNLPPVIDASGVQIIQPSCIENGSIQGLITNGNQPFTYSWTNSNETSISLLDASPGSYTLTVTDVNGCSTAFGPTVLNTPTGPTASFTWSPQEPSENSQVVFIDNSTGTIVNYSWSINGQSFSGEQVDYTVIEGEYTIQLTVTDDNGCSDTYTITLPVFDGLTIPNVMTLNNDGVNDFFLIEGLKSETNLTILNRWGEIVFSTNNYQNDWNGRDQSGALLTEGVYTYVLNAPNDKLKHGFIHLVR